MSEKKEVEIVEEAADKVEETPKKRFSWGSMKELGYIYSFVWPYKWYFLGGLFFLALSSLSALIFPYVTGQLVDTATGTPALLADNINKMTMILVVILLVQGVFSYFRVILFAIVSEKAMADIRKKLYQQLICLDIPFFEKRRVGELTSRITADITQLQEVLSFTLAELLRQVSILFFGVALIFWISPKLTLLMLSSFPLIVILTFVFGKYIRRLSRKTQDALADANVVVEETLQSIQTVKSFTNEGFEVNRYNTAIQEVVRFALKAANYRGLFASFIIYGIFGGIVLVLWYGSVLIANGTMSTGDLISFIIYTIYIGASVGGMGDMYGRIQRAVGATERVKDIIAKETEVDATTGDFKKITGDIVFEKVQFAYPAREDVIVLKELSLKILEGEKVALVGSSGAGKSTIVQLLMRFYQLASGQITIDGKNIEELDLKNLRRNVGIVPQEVILFGGTITENIEYGRPGASMEDIKAAARKANALEFVESFPEGFDTLVGDRGIKLSGGQRQRIAIARAILKDPAILILDEATSSLDAKSERLVQEALDELMKNRTTIIIAHRLATIRKVDRIYVIQEGRIIEEGSHEELVLLNDGIYQQLLKLQFQET